MEGVKDIPRSDYLVWLYSFGLEDSSKDILFCFIPFG